MSKRDEANAEKSPEELEKLKRDELEAAAREAGVGEPEKLPTKADIVEAMVHNPALVPEPPQPNTTPRTYLVVGTQAVHETAPGQTFTKLLNETQERFLIEGGAIQLVDDEHDTDEEKENG